jgi:outer membrane biosynthesis protein TonB
MNNIFYKAWLPLSVAFHVVLLLMLHIVPFSVPRQAGRGIIRVAIIDSAAYAAPKPREKKVEVVKPVPPPVKQLVEKPAHVTDGPIRTERANTREIGKQTQNPHITSGNANLPGDGKVNTEKGAGVGATKAPSLMTAPGGTGAVPPGDPEGTGSGGGEGLGPSGPSYGPKSKYGNSGGTNKAAGEINLVTDAVFTVQVSESGIVNSVTQVKTTGNGELDRIAARLVRARGYDPAMKNGQAVAASLSVKVKFNSGDFSFEDL